MPEPTNIIGEVRLLHEQAPGTWILTDSETTVILATASANAQHPGGGFWWRTHHLLRHLGINC